MPPHSFNPYSPPRSAIAEQGTAHSTPIGLLLGSLFALPLVLMLVVIAYRLCVLGRSTSLLHLILFFGPVALIVVYGWWWHTRGQLLGMLGFSAAAMLQGLLLILSIMGVIFLFLWLEQGRRPNFTSADWTPSFIGLAITIVWAALLGAAVRALAKKRAKAIHRVSTPGLFIE